MRITGGIHRSRKLETPKNDAVRPTSDKVRQALFNMLNSRGLVRDAIVLDAFCGTGALGLEALSQGAEQAIFIDKTKSSIDIVRQNIEILNVGGQSRVLLQDSTKIKQRSDDISQADLVFLDPPYHKGLVEKAVTALQASNWLNEECFFVIETAKDENVILDSLNIIQEKTYGDTKILCAQFS